MVMMLVMIRMTTMTTQTGATLPSIKGELIYKVTSYTPYPCEEDVAGERVRIDVGTLGKAQPRWIPYY